MTAFRQKHAGLTKVNNATLTPWIDEALVKYPALQAWLSTLSSVIRKRKPGAQKSPAIIQATNEKKKQLQDTLNTHEHNSFLRVFYCYLTNKAM
jgi:hypothetical protein